VIAERIDRREVRRGIVAMLPLWLGVAPFSFAFAVLARTSGFSTVETEALSLLVFAGSAQLAFVNLAKSGAGGVAILSTVLLLNLRHVLYGLSLNAHLPARTRPPRPVLAATMTDESYGLAIRAYRAGVGSEGYFFGASFSLAVGFMTATLIGTVIGSRLPDPGRLGLEVVFPLSFLALLLPLVRSRFDAAVAVVAGTLALLMSRWFGAGVVVPTATMVAAALGVLVDRRSPYAADR
jgi:branched chain amino acid efflux pump